MSDLLEPTGIYYTQLDLPYRADSQDLCHRWTVSHVVHSRNCNHAV